MKIPSLFLALISTLLTSALSRELSQNTQTAIDRAVQKAIAGGETPGAVLWIEAGDSVYRKTYGFRAIEPARERMTLDTIFDVASLTKVLATAPAIALLEERGALNLDAPVSSLIPEFRGHGKESITVRHLLTHTSGLLPGVPKAEMPPPGYDATLDWIYNCEPKTTPNSEMIYSDLNFILLGEIVRRVTGENLDTFAQREIWAPLGMLKTGYRPPAPLRTRIAPTEKSGETYLRGQVHDPTCRRMGSITGNAGVFSTAGDIARYARMILNGGELDGVRVMARETVAKMTAIQVPEHVEGKRGLGWDIDSWLSKWPRGERFPIGQSFGHTGYTGPSLWIDPTRDMFVLLLCNRLHPDGRGDVRRLRHDIATLAAEAVSPPALATQNEAARPSKKVLNGIDVLANDRFQALDGMRVGLITNHTGLSREGRSTIDLLHEAPNVDLRALFGPEHGIRGELDQANVSDGRDDKTGLPVYSLYSSDSKKPAARHLAGLDAIVFDIQDIGCRFYTYISTMQLAMEAAAENGLSFVVLDRVNPIGGHKVDGPVRISEEKFVAPHPIAIRHGMTVGELAKMFQAEDNIGVNLTVVPVQNWKRSMYFDETGLTWVNPSPNMRSLTEAILYPGIGLTEFTNLSVGRGTATPFELAGAPYIDDNRLAANLGSLNLPGIRFDPIRFTPTASKFENQECGGVRFTITDRETFRPLDTGLSLAKTLARTYPNYEIDKLSVLLVHPETLQSVKTQKSLDEIRAIWKSELRDFQNRRAKYLLYD